MRGLAAVAVVIVGLVSPAIADARRAAPSIAQSRAYIENDPQLEHPTIYGCNRHRYRVHCAASGPIEVCEPTGCSLRTAQYKIEVFWEHGNLALEGEAELRLGS